MVHFPRCLHPRDFELLFTAPRSSRGFGLVFPSLFCVQRGGNISFLFAENWFLCSLRFLRTTWREYLFFFLFAENIPVVFCRKNYLCRLEKINGFSFFLQEERPFFAATLFDALVLRFGA